jgi:hypothetical protein
MKLLCLSDIHGEAAELANVLQESAGADLIVVAGDVTHLGGAVEAQSILGPLLASGVRLVAVAGNMDGDGVRSFLGERGLDLHGRGVVIHGVGFMGLGGGSPSPFRTPWEVGEEEAEDCLAAGLREIREAPYKVLVSHSPPRDSRLDETFLRRHVGSAAVRRFLDAGSVDLCICGHIHEAAGEDRVGRTLCVNLGPLKNGTYALVTIDGTGAHVTRRTR